MPTPTTTFRLRPEDHERLTTLAQGGSKTQVIRDLVAEALEPRACNWCGRTATDGHRIIVRSEYVGGLWVNEYCCDPDCRPDTVEGGAT